MEQGIRGAVSIAVCVGGDGLGPWQSEEMQAALQLAVRENRPVIPVLLPDAPLRPELPMFLTNRTWVDLRDGIDGAGLDQLIWGITGERPDGFIERDNSTETPTGHRRILAAGGMIAMVLVLLLWWA